MPTEPNEIEPGERIHHVTAGSSVARSVPVVVAAKRGDP
jgi:hypothetical protein